MVAKRYGSRQERRAARQKARTDAKRDAITENRQKVQAERAAAKNAPEAIEEAQVPDTAEDPQESQEGAATDVSVEYLASDLVGSSVAVIVETVGDDKELAAAVLELEGLDGRKTLIAALEEVIDG